MQQPPQNTSYYICLDESRGTSKILVTLRVCAARIKKRKWEGGLRAPGEKFYLQNPTHLGCAYTKMARLTIRHNTLYVLNVHNFIGREDKFINVYHIPTWPNNVVKATCVAWNNNRQQYVTDNRHIIFVLRLIFKKVTEFYASVQ